MQVTAPGVHHHYFVTPLDRPQRSRDIGLFIKRNDNRTNPGHTSKKEGSRSDYFWCETINALHYRVKRKPVTGVYAILLTPEVLYDSGLLALYTGGS